MTLVSALPASAAVTGLATMTTTGWGNRIMDPQGIVDRELGVALPNGWDGFTVVKRDGRIPDAATCRRLVRRVLEGFALPYITISPTFSICPAHGYLAGEYRFCPRCDEAIGHVEQAEHG